MPIYEYKCKSCCTKFEERRGFEDVGPALCPVCRKEARRIFSPVPIIYKGSGFYCTDNKSGS